MTDLTWTDDEGVPFARPQTVLGYKATWRQPTDDADLDAAWPLIHDARAWLHATLTTEYRGHL